MKIREKSGQIQIFRSRFSILGHAPSVVIDDLNNESEKLGGAIFLANC
jgi:hypothetical protein